MSDGENTTCPACGGTRRVLMHKITEDKWVMKCGLWGNDGCGHEFPLNEKQEKLKDAVQKAEFIDPEYFLLASSKKGES